MSTRTFFLLVAAIEALLIWAIVDVLQAGGVI